MKGNEKPVLTITYQRLIIIDLSSGVKRTCISSRIVYIHCISLTGSASLLSQQTALLVKRLCRLNPKSHTKSAALWQSGIHIDNIILEFVPKYRFSWNEWPENICPARLPCVENKKNVAIIWNTHPLFLAPIWNLKQGKRKNFVHKLCLFHGTHSLIRLISLANNPFGKEMIAFEDKSLWKK